MRSKKILFLILFLIPISTYAQNDLQNKDYFSAFLDSTKKSLLMVGENHSSSVGPKIFPELIKHLHKENGLRNILIEFGPSSAYFYSLYLQSGNEKWLNYTVNGTYYVDWKKAWKMIYKYNLTLEHPLQIRGIDFDRGRTFGYALYNIFKEYENRPTYIDSLMKQVKDTTFYNNHTIGYPTKNDLRFVKKTRSLLSEYRKEIKTFLNSSDFLFVDRMMKNEALNYGKNREQNIAQNSKRIIEETKSDDFLLLIGRSHAYRDAIYDDNPRLVSMLSKDSSFSTLAGVILHEDSQQWGKDYKKAITLFEVRDKIPWKEYYEEIDRKAKSDLTIIPLKNDLKPLRSYTDYIIVARNKGPIKVVQ